MKSLSINKQTDNKDFYMASFNGEDALHLAYKGTYADAINEALCLWGLHLDNVIVKIDAEIDFNYDAGEYGSHDGFFNAVVEIGVGHPYHFQCCTDDDGNVDLNDCGYMTGQCGDCNEKLADIVGWDGVLYILERAYAQYEENDRYKEIIIGDRDMDGRLFVRNGVFIFDGHYIVAKSPIDDIKLVKYGSTFEIQCDTWGMTIQQEEAEELINALGMHVKEADE